MIERYPRSVYRKKQGEIISYGFLLFFEAYDFSFIYKLAFSQTNNFQSTHSGFFYTAYLSICCFTCYTFSQRVILGILASISNTPTCLLLICRCVSIYQSEYYFFGNVKPHYLFLLPILVEYISLFYLTPSNLRLISFNNGYEIAAFVIVFRSYNCVFIFTSYWIEAAFAIILLNSLRFSF